MSVTWSAEFRELRREWIALPDKCVAEADRLAEDAARGCAQAVRTVYAQHWKTGTLTKRTIVTRFHKGKFQAAWLAKAAAPHAGLFERGTRKRFSVTQPGKTKGSGGKIHAHGAMPAFWPFAKIAPGFRRWMNHQLILMLKRQKLGVSGHV